MALSSAFLPDF